MMSRPSLLLLDEPSMGLAPVLVEAIFSIVEEINRQGTTILLVEQNALMALQIASRGYVLQTGEIVLSDNARALQRNAMVQKVYLGIPSSAILQNRAILALSPYIMELRLFSAADVRRARPMAEAIAAVKAGFVQLSAGRAQVPLRVHLSVGDGDRHADHALLCPR